MNNLFEGDLVTELNNIAKQISDVQRLTENRFCIYTCLIGDFDEFNEIATTLVGCDSFIITDNKKLHYSNTNSIFIDSIYRSGRRTNRIFKILPHLFFSKYTKSVYYDCNLVLKVSPLEILGLLNSKYDFAIFNHAKRNCLFEEIDECIFWNKDSKTLLNIQREKYESVPKQNGLYLGSVLVRNHNNLSEFSECWWSQYDEFSARDQISLAYTYYKIKINFQIVDISNFGLYFDKVPHIKKNVNEAKLSVYQSLRFKILMFIVNIRKKL